MMPSEKSQLPVESKSSSELVKIDSPDSIHEKEAASFAENITRKGQIMGSQNTLSGQIIGNPNPNNGMIAPAGVKEQINSAKGSGDKLPNSVKRMMKESSGELDDVRIHTDSKAAEVAKVLNAKAFTYGKDIFFGQGMFDSNTTEGKELIAHEVQHTKHNNPCISRSKEKDDDKNVLDISTFPWLGKINTEGVGFHKEPKPAVDSKTDYIRPDFRSGDSILIKSKTSQNWLFGERASSNKKQTGYVDWRYVNQVQNEENESEQQMTQLDAVRFLFDDLLSAKNTQPVLQQTVLNENDKSYEYHETTGLTSAELYINILNEKVSNTIGPQDAIAITSILAGAPLFAKRFVTPGAIDGTSAASILLSKIPGTFPIKMPTFVGGLGTGIAVRYTTSVGRFAARAVPYIGWALLLYDLITIISEACTEYENKTNEDGPVEFGGFGGGSSGGAGSGSKW